MNLRLRIIIAVIIIAALCVLINMIRKKHLEIKYALSWLFVGIGVLLFDCIPGLMEWLSALLGIASPVNMLFFLGFCFSIVIIFTLTVAISRMSVRLKKLAQEVSLQEKDRSHDNETNK